MVAAAAFALGFILIGLTVVFFAFGGGVRGARSNLHRQGRAGRRTALVVTGAVIVLFGIAIPTVVIAANNHHQSKQAKGGLALNAAEQHGRQIFARNCATCHTLDAASAVGKVGPNLDDLRPPAGLVLNAIKLGRARGQGQMPAELVDGKDAKDVAKFVAATAGRG
jgi:mono/diheme cytochrome c family protein